MTHLDELKAAIHKLHGARATHRESVPVKKVFKGETVWDGIVEVFDLHGHSKANTAYAWLHDTGDPEKPAQHVTVLHVPPVVSPLTAVQAFILQEIRNAQAAQAYASRTPQDGQGRSQRQNCPHPLQRRGPQESYSSGKGQGLDGIRMG
jgi:hypothetical protein